MPRYRVKGPDGRTFIVNAPDGATKEQVLAYARSQAPKAAEKPRTGGLGIPMLDGIISSANEALIGVGEGLYNVGSAITDPIAHTAIRAFKGKDAADAALAAERTRRGNFSDATSRTLVSRPDSGSRLAGRIAGTMAVPIPKVGGAGLLATGTNRAVQGAVGGAGVREVDQGAALPASIGAAANVALPPLLARAAQTRAGQAAGRAAGRIAAPIVSAADDAAEAVLGRAAPRLGITHSPLPANAPLLPSAGGNPLEPLGRKAAARAARFKSLGIENPTTGMVTRNPQAFSFEQNISKVQGVGDDLGQQIRDVETALVKKGRDLVRSQGGSKGAEATGESVQKALDAKRAELQQVTSRLYTQVRETRGDEAVGTLGGLRDTLRHPDVVDNATFDAIRGGVMRRLQRLGLVDDVGSAVEGKTTTVGQAEELRKFIGGLGDARDPAVRMIRGKLIDALDDDVVAAVGDDAFKAARASARARFEEFGKTAAGRIADEGIAPEALTRRVLSPSFRLSDLRALRKSLHTGTPDQITRGQEAWKGLRAQALDDLFRASSNDEGLLHGGKLATDFYKQSAKFRELLDPQDFKTLTRLVQASRDATAAPPRSSVNYSNTATTAANFFQSMKPQTREGWLKLLAKNGAQHAAAFLAGGPPANVGLMAGKQVAGGVSAAAAEQRAAAELARRVQMASSPEEFAAAIRELQNAAQSNAAAREALSRVGKLFGASGAATQGQ